LVAWICGLTLDKLEAILGNSWQNTFIDYFYYCALTF
jgi:hypothetical protein